MLSRATLKLVMLLTMTSSSLKACTPPNKETSSDKIEKGAFTKYVHILTKIMVLPTLLMPSLTLSFVLLSKILSLYSSTFMDICSRDVNHELDRLPPLFLGSFLLVASGASLRLLCYKALGKFFTFKVTIRSNHKIIDTGPYGIVRHPAYTGGFFMYAGAALLVFSSQNPVITCGWTASSFPVKFIMAWWTFTAVFFNFNLVRRIPIEEQNLRVHFGQEWDDYVKRVPYRCIPGVY